MTNHRLIRHVGSRAVIIFDMHTIGQLSKNEASDRLVELFQHFDFNDDDIAASKAFAQEIMCQRDQGSLH